MSEGWNERELSPADLDRMLDGSTEWPPEMSGLRRAVQAPGRPDELAGEDAAVAAFRSAYPSPAPVGRRAPGRFFGLRVAAVMAATVLAGGGIAIAAATGTIPHPGGDSPPTPVPNITPASPDRGSTPRQIPTGEPSTPPTPATGQRSTAGCPARPALPGSTGSAGPTARTGDQRGGGNGQGGGNGEGGGNGQGGGNGGGQGGGNGNGEGGGPQQRC